MASKKMSDQHQLAAYLLNKELNYSQKSIANLMDVAQGTVSNAVREAEHKIKEYNLEQELKEMRRQLEEKGYASCNSLTLPPVPVIDIDTDSK